MFTRCILLSTTPGGQAWAPVARGARAGASLSLGRGIYSWPSYAPNSTLAPLQPFLHCQAPFPPNMETSCPPRSSNMLSSQPCPRASLSGVLCNVGNAAMSASYLSSQTIASPCLLPCYPGTHAGRELIPTAMAAPAAAAVKQHTVLSYGKRACYRRAKGRGMLSSHLKARSQHNSAR